VMPVYFEKFGQRIQDMDVRDDDIWVCSYPKTGKAFNGKEIKKIRLPPLSVSILRTPRGFQSCGPKQYLMLSASSRFAYPCRPQKCLYKKADEKCRFKCSIGSHEPASAIACNTYVVADKHCRN
jgi:hypothetical protein